MSWGPPSKNSGQIQKHPKFGAISDDFNVRRRISRDIQNQRSTRSKEISHAFVKKIPVNFGLPSFTLLITVISRWKHTHLNRLFQKTILPSMAPKFLHALENDQVLLAHLPPGTRSP